MTASAFARGHRIIYNRGEWRYADTGATLTEAGERPCAACGLTAEPDGPDPCLGMLPGVVAACCGHGVEPGYAMRPTPTHPAPPR